MPFTLEEATIDELHAAALVPEDRFVEGKTAGGSRFTNAARRG